MRFRAFTSLGAKLFYYMSGLVLLTVVGNSIQFRKSFMDSQTKNVQESVQTQAERAASHVESIIEAWRSQLAVALPTLRGSNEKSPDEAIQRFIDSNPDYIAIQLLSAPKKGSTDFIVFGQAFTSGSTDPRFEEKNAKNIRESMLKKSVLWLQRQVPKESNASFLMENAGKTTDLPIVWVAARFDVTGEDTVVWALLSVWQSNLVRGLAKSKSVQTRVVNREGRIFSAPTLGDLLGKIDISHLSLTKAAARSSSPSGFTKEFIDREGRRRVGAYSRLPRYGLTVLVEQDVEFAYQALRENLLNTALWASLFILISIMFAFVGATGITKGLRTVAEATARIAGGDFQSEIHLNSRDEVGLLGEAVNNMSSKIVELLTSHVEKARFEKELETAQMVQSTFFPKSNLSTEDLFIAGFYQPASECGGDLWGHFSIEEGLEFVFVADAMGHGAPAALVTAMAYSSMRTIADIIKENKSLRESPAKIITLLNRIMWDALRGSISMTFFASIIDLNRGTLTYANAGHNFPVLLPHSPNDSRSASLKPVSKTSTHRPISLKLMGTPLGMNYDALYKDQSMAIEPGDKLFYFTDGLIECESRDGNVLGRKWLLENICDLGEGNANQMKDTILKRAFEFFGANPIKDDITVVTLEISKSWSPRFKPQHPESSTIPPISDNPFDIASPSRSMPAPQELASLSPQEDPIDAEVALSSDDRTPLGGPFFVALKEGVLIADNQDSSESAAKTQPLKVKSPFSA